MRKEYVPTEELICLKNVNGFILTKHIIHEDYAVWDGDTIVAQGGNRLMHEVFEQRSKTMDTTAAPAAQPADTNTQPAAPVTPKVIDLGTRIEQYVKLRDMIKEKDDAHKKVMEPYRDALEKLNNLLLDHLNTIGGDSVKTEHGTVYRTVKKSASLEDADAFMKHVIKGEHWELLDRKANKTAVEAYVDENGVLPPGVKWSSISQVGVRRA